MTRRRPLKIIGMRWATFFAYCRKHEKRGFTDEPSKVKNMRRKVRAHCRKYRCVVDYEETSRMSGVFHNYLGEDG